VIEPEQLKTILWLRWRLTRNQWQRAGGFGAVLAGIVAVGAVMLGGATFIGGLLGAALGFGEAKPVGRDGHLVRRDRGVSLFWLIGLLAELQRAETIDLQRLMHLPVALGRCSSSIMSRRILRWHHPDVAGDDRTGARLTFAVGRRCCCFAAGLEHGLHDFRVDLLPARWLATMMSNPRRRRAIIMGITLAFILTFQLPNFYFNVFGGRKRFDRPKNATPEEMQRDRAARDAKDNATVTN